jgi:putative transcriptional regulator
MTSSARGKLLVATPILADPNFLRTVVLVLEHTDDGALGVVLNRPSATFLAELLPGWAGLAVEPGLVHIGGPVQPSGVIGLAQIAPSEVPDPTVRLLWPGVATVDLETSPDDLAGAVRGVRCFAGYAGWSPGQLDAEVDTGSWFVVDRDPDDLWTADATDLWRTVLWRQPGRLRQFALCPLDASTN